MRKLYIFFISIVSFIPFINKRNDYVDVTKVIYINSIHLDFDDDTNNYISTFYILNNFNLAKADLSSNNVDTLAYTIEVNGRSLTEVFEKINFMTNVYVHYDHLRTVILSNNFLNEKSLKAFYIYIKDNLNIFPTFYLFTSSSKASDLFNVENFSEISAYHTFLVNPNLVKSYYLTTFLDFAKAINISNYTLTLPNLTSIKDAFKRQDKNFISLQIDGYTFLNGFNTKTFSLKEYPILKWLYILNNSTYVIKNYDLYIKKGNTNIKKINNIININIKINGTITKKNDLYSEKENKNRLLEEIYIEINELYSFIINNKCDIFNINYRFGNDTNYYLDNTMKFNIKLIIS